ncbi:MAG: hypothetical protein BWX80_02336 [Candidatus Hydrogenedentes bacterium ADurb.Bin101]|nr:MAG: hypothetical protein BWX80_02336 [Candidatus Hydrogenedentes bacterium ADurb.Bin101]
MRLVQHGNLKGGLGAVPGVAAQGERHGALAGAKQGKRKDKRYGGRFFPFARSRRQRNRRQAGGFRRCALSGDRQAGFNHQRISGQVRRVESQASRAVGPCGLQVVEGHLDGVVRFQYGHEAGIPLQVARGTLQRGTIGIPVYLQIYLRSVLFRNGRAP